MACAAQAQVQALRRDNARLAEEAGRAAAAEQARRAEADAAAARQAAELRAAHRDAAAALRAELAREREQLLEARAERDLFMTQAAEAGSRQARLSWLRVEVFMHGLEPCLSLHTG